jgi:hypothetical protein
VFDLRKDFVLLVLLASLALLLPILLFGCVSQPQPQAVPSITPSIQPSLAAFASPSLPSPLLKPSAAAKFAVVFTINNGTANYSKEVEVDAGATVLAALEANFVVTKKEYSFGSLVTGIDGLEQNDSTQRYWQYYVDGVLAPVGASDFKVEKNLSVEWRYETPAFE